MIIYVLGQDYWSFILVKIHHTNLMYFVVASKNFPLIKLLTHFF